MFGHPKLGTWDGDGSGENSEGSSAVSWYFSQHAVSQMEE